MLTEVINSRWCEGAWEWLRWDKEPVQHRAVFLWRINNQVFRWRIPRAPRISSCQAMLGETMITTSIFKQRRVLDFAVADWVAHDGQVHLPSSSASKGLSVASITS